MIEVYALGLVDKRYVGDTERCASTELILLLQWEG